MGEIADLKREAEELRSRTREWEALLAGQGSDSEISNRHIRFAPQPEFRCVIYSHAVCLACNIILGFLVFYKNEIGRDWS